MVTKFDSKEYAKQRLFNLCAKYFPSDHLKINTGRKGFRLGESTIALIDKSKEILSRAQESNETIPVSTVNVFRYGMVCLEIFEDLSKFQVVSQLKSRSRRGYRKELEIVDFDLKKIELEFKKSSNPNVKSQKDARIILNARRSYLKPLDTDDFLFILNDVIKKQELFIVDDSDGKQFFDSLFRLINPLASKNNQRIKYEILLEEKQNELEKKTKLIAELNKKIPTYKHQIELQRENSRIPKIIQEKEQLFFDPDLSLFLKILTTSLERYVKMIERRENRILEEKEDFLGLILEPTRFQRLDEELWRKIVFIIETHGLELVSGKSWFRFEDSTELRQFIVQKEVLEKFARIRTLENELNDAEDKLQQNPQYTEALKMIKEYEEIEALILKLRKEIPELNEKIKELTREIENDKNKVETFLY
ncbi:MAG: hypothetical protein ACFFB2_07365 [Promethearchaeota archaeon]